jgi:ATP-dependent Clp protease ATP-binding subunit ClpA
MVDEPTIEDAISIMRGIKESATTACITDDAGAAVG